MIISFLFTVKQYKGVDPGKVLKTGCRDKKKIGNYYNLLDSWKQVFGQENLIVRVYEKEQLTNGLLHDFSTSIGLKIDGKFIKDLPKQNITPNPKVIKFMLFINKMTRSGRMPIIKSWWKLASFYNRMFLTPDSKISDIIFKLPDFLINNNELISMRERIDILSEFEESNQKVAKEYFGRSNGILFYSNPQRIMKS